MQISELERSTILQRIINELRDDDRIIAVLLAGSTAFGFNDRFSDIDLVIITPDDSFEQVCQTWSKWIEKTYRILQSFNGAEHEHKHIFVFLLEGFLEIDLVFEAWSAVSHKHPWTVAFDKSGQVEEKLKSLATQEAHSQLSRYRENIGSVWYHVTHGAAALKRGKLWRAYYETLQLMYKTAELAGIYWGKETEDFQSLDELPPEFLERLSKGATGKLTLINLEKTFREIVDLYFDQAQKLDESLGVKVGKETEQLLVGYLSQVLEKTEAT